MGSFSYAKLFLLLQKKGIKQYQLQEMAGITAPTMSKLVKGETVKTDSLAKICDALDCQPGDIMEYRKDSYIPDIDDKVLSDLYDRYDIYHDIITIEDFRELVLHCIDIRGNGILIIDQNKLNRLIKKRAESEDGGT